MENRGQKYHRGRMAEALREEIVALVEGELGDPRIGLVSVSEVLLGPTAERPACWFQLPATRTKRSRASKG